MTASCPDFSIDARGLPATVLRKCQPVECRERVCQFPDETGLEQPTATGLEEQTATAACQTTEIQTYTFNAIFRPTVRGTVSCVVTVTLNNTTNRSITLTGTGTPPPRAVDVQPGAVAFGDVRQGANSTEQTITVGSTGAEALDVSSVTASSGFVIMSGPTAAYSLAPATTQDYKVACHPGTIGVMSGELVVRSSDEVQARLAVPLSCNGIDSNLDIQPSPASLRPTRVGEPVDTTIDLRNTGGARMTLENVSIMGSAITMISAPELPMVLDPSVDIASIDVHFDASVPGDAAATLVVSYDGGKRRTSQINARALPTSMALTPDGEVNFGPVCIGQRKTQEFVALANDQGSFSLRGVSDPGAPFTVSMPPLPITMFGGGLNVARFQITAAPTVEGVATATAVIQTDIPKAPDHPVNLSVHGLLMGVTATPAAVDLGSREINKTTIGQQVHLSNCSMSELTFTKARIEGLDAADFAIVAQPDSSTIESNGVASWLVVLQAQSVGLKHAVFMVDHDGGTEAIDLFGEGLAEPGGDGRDSYYACATGQSTALWPLAIALVFVLRRRARRRGA